MLLESTLRTNHLNLLERHPRIPPVTHALIDGNFAKSEE